MNPWLFPFALITFLGFVMVMPGWSFFLTAHGPNLTAEGQFIATLVLPALVLLFIASWLQPRGGNS